MKIELEEKDVHRAASTALKWLSSDETSPNSWIEDLTILKYMMMGILEGKLKLVENTQVGPIGSEEPGEIPVPPIMGPASPTGPVVDLGVTGDVNIG